MSECALVRGAERLITGRLTPGNVFLLSALAGIGKTTFGISFLYEALIHDMPGMILLTDYSPKDLFSISQSLGMDLGKNGEKKMPTIIDCYSSKLGEKETMMQQTYIVNEPSVLSNVSIAIDENREKIRGGRFVIDNISSLILALDIPKAVSFLSTLSARLKRDNIDCLFILEGGVHDEKMVNTLRYISDGIFEMRIDESNDKLARLFRIFSIRGTRHETYWVPFEITTTGVELKSNL